MFMRTSFAALLWFAAGTVAALQPAPPVAAFAATGTVQYAFTTEDHADEMIIAAIDAARRQVLMQAYSLTHRRIADALVRAKSRGVEVAVIADQEQAACQSGHYPRHGACRRSAAAGCTHAAAHNKIIVIDTVTRIAPWLPAASISLTRRNTATAENALILRGQPAAVRCLLQQLAAPSAACARAVETR